MTPDWPTALTLHRPYLTRVVGRMLWRTPDSVEDTVQDVMMKAWKKRGQYREDASVRTWLHRIAVNTVLMGMRRRRLRTVELDAMLEDGERTYVDIFSRRDSRVSLVPERLALTRALAELSPAQRRAVLLQYVWGYTFREVGEREGVPGATAKNRGFRGMWKMRGRMKEGERCER